MATYSGDDDLRLHVTESEYAMLVLPLDDLHEEAYRQINLALKLDLTTIGSLNTESLLALRRTSALKVLCDYYARFDSGMDRSNFFRRLYLDMLQNVPIGTSSAQEGVVSPKRNASVRLL